MTWKTILSAVDPRGPYFEQLEKMIRFDVLRKAKGQFRLRRASTAAARAGSTAFSPITAWPSRSIRTKRDVLFDGTGPDPSEENLAPLKKPCLKRKRWPVSPPTATRTASASSIATALSYLAESHSRSRCSITCSKRADTNSAPRRSVATTHLLDAVARLHGVKVYETPVGFKYVGPLLREDKIALGGEESAGMTIRGHLPEKDGILACLLVAEMIAARGASLGDQLRDLFRRVGGEFWPIRMNLHLPAETQAKLPERLRENFQGIRGAPRGQDGSHRRLATDFRRWRHGS